MSEKILGIIRFGDPVRSQYGDILLITDYPSVMVVKEFSKKSKTRSNKALDSLLGLAASSAGSQYTAFDTHVRSLDKETEKKILECTTVEDVKKVCKKSFSISNSEILKIELRKSLWRVKLNIITKHTKYGWMMTLRQVRDKLEDYEKILRLAFGDKLVSKWR